MTTMKTRIVHLTVERDWREVYDFVSKPQNMPLWASGLASGLEEDGPDWIAHGELGDVRIRFSPLNDFGVVDHVVTMPTGAQVHNALRVVPNGDGAEVAFTLLQLPDMSDEQFEKDAAWVLKDLQALKRLLES